VTCAARIGHHSCELGMCIKLSVVIPRFNQAGERFRANEPRRCSRFRYRPRTILKFGDELTNMMKSVERVSGWITIAGVSSDQPLRSARFVVHEH